MASPVAQVSYVYGVVSADLDAAPELGGVGSPAGEVSLIRHRRVAALVSPIDSDRPLGKPEDLRAHFDLLNATATRAPVLPLLFGSVMLNDEAVSDDLLAPYHDVFVEGLEELKGHVQYLVKARYQQDVLLREVLAGNGEAARLQQEISTLSVDAGRQQRIALGEIVHSFIEATREADTVALLQAVEPCAKAVQVRQTGTEQDAFQVAVLLTPEDVDVLEQTVADLGRKWSKRLTPELLGPLAAYDFVDALAA